MAKKDDRVKVSERAIVARLRRTLEKEGKILKKCREDNRFFNELGSYYCVSSANVVVDKDIDIESWSRELGILKPYEVIGE
jgi:hypothetical protein